MDDPAPGTVVYLLGQLVFPTRFRSFYRQQDTRLQTVHGAIL